MNDIYRDDLIAAYKLQVVSLVMGLAIGALLVALPVAATYPDENVECVVMKEGK